MSEDVPPSPKPRWRPRFSLRTLLIGVLLFGFSWTSTVVWGVPDVKENLNYLEFYQRDEVEVSCIAPFLISVHQKFPTWENSEQCLWVFGWKYKFNTKGHVHSYIY